MSREDIKDLFKKASEQSMESREILEEKLRKMDNEKQKIYEEIKNFLDEMDMVYQDIGDDVNVLSLSFGVDNKPFTMYIVVDRGKVVLQTEYPFRVKTNAIAYASMKINSLNNAKVFKMNLDVLSGRIFIEQTQFISSADIFAESLTEFRLYFLGMAEAMADNYGTVLNIAAGKASSKDSLFYSKLLEYSKGMLQSDGVETENENKFGGDAIEGLNDTMRPLLPDVARKFFADLLKKDMDEDMRDSFVEDDEPMDTEE